jgi:hypothetical protein
MDAHPNRLLVATCQSQAERYIENTTTKALPNRSFFGHKANSYLHWKIGAYFNGGYRLNPSQ